MMAGGSFKTEKVGSLTESVMFGLVFVFPFPPFLKILIALKQRIFYWKEWGLLFICIEIMVLSFTWWLLDLSFCFVELRMVCWLTGLNLIKWFKWMEIVDILVDDKCQVKTPWHRMIIFFPMVVVIMSAREYRFFLYSIKEGYMAPSHESRLFCLHQNLKTTLVLVLVLLIIFFFF